MNPNSKIPELIDYSEQTPRRVFESGAILLYLADKFGAFLPKDRRKRTEALNWLLADGFNALSRRRLRNRSSSVGRIARRCAIGNRRWARCKRGTAYDRQSGSMTIAITASEVQSL